MGRSGTCLWKVLAGFAGWFREKTTHLIAWRLSDKSVARQRLREFLEREGVNSKEAFHQDTAPVVTIRQQADWWVVSLQTRKRRP
jgi:hypothetical protein